MIFSNPLLWAFLALGLSVGYFVRNLIATRRARRIEETIRKRISDAKVQAQGIISDAQQQSIKLLEDVKKEEKETKEKLEKTEERLHSREESLEKQLVTVGEREERLSAEREKVSQERDELKEVKEKTVTELEKIASLSKEEAKEKIFEEVKEAYKTDLTETIQHMEHDRKDEIEKKASDIITGALMRYSRSHVSDVTTTVFTLPSEDLKGKIIGREGRNIKALERATGVDIIVDETPETVILSSFDPLRREIAKISLERLVTDGRIQPARIEETVEEVKQDLIKRMQDIGEEASMEVGVVGFPKEILQLIGRLHFRTSYGQNVLTHSIEMAHIAGMIARELGSNIDVAKKGALVHDIGKAISHEVEGTHVDLGMKILTKYGVDESVINAMRSHHEDYPFASPESFIVTAADILSAGRPGARRDSVEQYLKRLRDLEGIASNFKGVKQAYALSAGREIRIFVVPEQIDDFGALQMAKDIASKVQHELKYPGEIKVNVIRETRAVEYAR
ncbi:MAG: ribonuclease Y [Candidatus Harrisonbacteria bacterium CG10_big_fil_rev_8_21_14_0_10_44_23]|uniref:Ribonuclease Y n=1 Tax=Candidatus Harrisonbacteria bacterium CG10_big_fil_rev_8_21_14_0_10_44_23 TaxID=1974585 RepID=A0A2H0UQM2_9BACT|nr:MAG: ribonuclease Y [Candidatus Harrisonbacteria bacterium CG10_big_fil_rev_8_21_14_0_10_44_23]